MYTELTENQRFNTALEYLKNQNIFSSDLEFLEMTGFKRSRLSYLKQEDGGSLKAEEIQTLEKTLPDINWRWVKFGDGNMLSSMETNEPMMVKESSVIYQKNPDHKELLMSIMTGNSTLPESEQKKILIQEVINLQNKLLTIYDQVDPASLFSNLKALIKGKI